jgi:hypothetical protein
MSTAHRISTTAVLILSLAAAGTPAASARPAGPDTASAINTQSSTARPNPDEQTATGVSDQRTSAALYSRQDKSLIPASQTAASTAATGRAALARSSAQQERQRIAALSAYRAGQLATALDVATTSANRARAPQATVQVQPPQSGFDWGDAGIGAAGGLALAMLAVGGGLVISQQRPRRTRTTKSLPS